MRYPVWLIIGFCLICAFGQSVFAQNPQSGFGCGQDIEAYFSNQTNEFIRYCQLELFPKFEKRRYGITPLYGQANSFEIWADSLNRRYLVSVDIAEEGWSVNRRRAIPIIFSQYSDDYNIDAYVEIFHDELPIPILAKKYLIVVNAKNSYQVFKDNPDWNRLYVPFKVRQMIQKQAIKTLAARLSSDIFNLIN
jgi:hypothetical protein